MFSGGSSGSGVGGLLQNLGFGTQPTQIVDPSSCMIALDGAKQEISNKSAEILQQKRDVDYLKSSLPDLNKKLEIINQEIQQQQADRKSTRLNSSH